MRTKHHLAVNIDGMVKIMGRKRWDKIFENEDGSFLTHNEAKEFIKECKGKGYKYFPNHSCKGFDPFKNGISK